MGELERLSEKCTLYALFLILVVNSGISRILKKSWTFTSSQTFAVKSGTQ